MEEGGNTKEGKEDSDEDAGAVVACCAVYHAGFWIVGGDVEEDGTESW
jgi:hypothetical protein